MIFDMVTNKLFKAILDGEAAVGDAKKLGGKEASEYALLTELTKYMPLSGGGVVNGNIEVKASDTTGRTYKITNSLRSVSNMINSAGIYFIYDITNGKVIVESKADGTNTFNGTASENLPITGGKITNATGTPLEIHNSTSGGVITLINYGANGVELGRLGFYGVDKPVIRTTAGQYHSLHHDGNSTKVVVSETPLTAEGSVRVW